MKIYRHLSAAQQEEAREYYGLDDLYGDCPNLDWKSIPVEDTGEFADAEA